MAGNAAKKFTEDGVAGEYGKTAVKPVVAAYRDVGGLVIIPSRPMVEGRALGRELGAGSVMSHRVQLMETGRPGDPGATAVSRVAEELKGALVPAPIPQWPMAESLAPDKVQ